MNIMHVLLTAGALLAVAACGSSGSVKNEKADSLSEVQDGSRVLVAYFSATGTTRQAAEYIAAAANGTIYEIRPDSLYTAADLDWQNPKSRSSIEMKDSVARPLLHGGVVPDMTRYNVVFVGYPIWWDEAPRVINTWIEANDLREKAIIPFATSGGSTITNSVDVLKKTYPSLDWQQGRLLNNPSEAQAETWVRSLNL